MPFRCFSKWQLSIILHWLDEYLDHHEVYLIVFIVLQNLVGIHALVSMIGNIQYFCTLGLEVTC